jgi:hypothetical protein
MPGRGPAPKESHQRERDTRRRQADVVEVTDDGEIRGPALDGGPFSPNTVAWYETWRHAPQAALFESTDWLRLQMLAPIVDLYWRKPTAAALSEIRLNEERLGATYVDRLRAKIRVAQAEDGPDATVTHLHAVARDDVAARLRGESKSEGPAPF